MHNQRSLLDFPRNEAGLVDKFIGTAFDAVYQIYLNLEEVLRSKGYSELALQAKQAAEAAAALAIESADEAAASAAAALQNAELIVSRVEEAIAARDAAEASAILSLSYTELAQAAIIQVNEDRRVVEQLRGETEVFAATVGPIREDFADATGVGKGTALLGHRRKGSGTVGRTQESINAEVLSPLDYGLVGDGTNEKAKLDAYLADLVGAGMQKLTPGKVYGFTGVLTIPAGVQLDMNGSSFRRLRSDPDYGIVIKDNVRLRKVKYSAIGGDYEGGINIQGSDFDFDTVRVSFDLANTGNLSNRNGILASGLTGGQFKRMWVLNHSKPYNYQAVSSIDAGPMFSNNATLAVYVLDARDSTFKGGKHSGVSPTAVGTPGQNGLLIESSYDYGSRNLTFEDWIVEDAPEHSYRIGGQFIVDNVKIVRCISRRAGSGSLPTGGTGFKVLGPNSRLLKHTNIFLTDCISEDAGQTPGDNFNALDLSYVESFQVSNFISRKDSRPFASAGGIRLAQLKNGTISNPLVRDTITGPLRIVDAASASGVSIEDVSITGGQMHRSEYDVIQLDPKSCIYKNLTIVGLSVKGGRSAIRAESPLSGGGYQNVRVNLIYTDPTDTTGGPAITGSNDIIYDVCAPWYGSYGASGKDGSVYQDTSSGISRSRVAGNWVTLTDIRATGGTWSPSFSGQVNVAAVSGNLCTYERVGNTVSGSGVIQISATAAGAVQVNITLPVPSVFTGFSQGVGLARSEGNETHGVLTADVATGTLKMALTATGTSARNVVFMFSYQIR